MSSAAVEFQKPAMRLPVPIAQNFAMLSCRAVRVSAIPRTSDTAALKAGEPKAGGGAGWN